MVHTHMEALRHLWISYNSIEKYKEAATWTGAHPCLSALHILNTLTVRASSEWRESGVVSLTVSVHSFHRRASQICLAGPSSPLRGSRGCGACGRPPAGSSPCRCGHRGPAVGDCHGSVDQSNAVTWTHTNTPHKDMHTGMHFWPSTLIRILNYKLRTTTFPDHTFVLGLTPANSTTASVNTFPGELPAVKTLLNYRKADLSQLCNAPRPQRSQGQLVATSQIDTCIHSLQYWGCELSLSAPIHTHSIGTLL